MSEFSPLRDPVFLLTWQVHLTVVILFALLGIWAGLTRRPWYVAPTLFLGLLWLFVPLEAPEPVVVLLLTVPVLAVACRVARRWLEKPEENSSPDSPSRLRFSLADLLWLTVVVGMLTGLLIQVFRARWEPEISWSATSPGMVLAIDWPEVALAGVCFVVLSLAILLAQRQQTPTLQVVGLGFVAFGELASAGLHHALVTQDWLLLPRWDAWIPDRGSMFRLSDSPTPSDLFVVYLITFVEFTALLWLGMQLLPAITVPSQTRSAFVVRSVAVTSYLIISLGLGSLYIKMQTPSPWPVEEFPEANERAALMPILERLSLLNREGLSIDDLYARDHDSAADEVDQLATDADKILRHNSITWFDSRHDPATLDGMFEGIHRCQLARNLGRTLGAQAESDWKGGQRAVSLNRTVTCLRLGKAMRQRRLAVDALVGKAMEEIAISHLVATRSELSCNEIHSLEPELRQLAATDESVELLLKRDKAFNDRALSWRGRLTRTLTRVLGIPLEEDDPTRFALQVRDAYVAMIRTDLAIRCYWQTQGEWPDDLDRLVPGELASLPVDPFCGQPLIYRKQDDEFVLYSVGRDGIDDGGVFGRYPDFLSKEKRIDIDLDAWTRGYD